MRVVLANGVFDVLHYGHLLHLREARSMGTRLVVALTLDDAVRKGPGRPLNKWPYRAAVMLELRCVSEVIASNSSIEAIYKVKPDIFVKGIDYAKGDMFTEDVEEACRFVGAEVRFTSTPKMSVSDIIKRTMALHA